MNEEKQFTKAAIRKACLDQRASLGESERKSKSRMIQQRLLDLPEFQQAQTIMLFLDFRDEVETTAIAEEMILRKKKLVLPRCAPKGIIHPIEVCDLSVDLEPGAWGIREPKLCNEKVKPLDIDLVIVPGAGFDLQGNRLGYGGGYYDRFFMLLNPLVPRIALAFECQVIEHVPTDEHDAIMTMLITENQVYKF